MTFQSMVQCLNHQTTTQKEKIFDCFLFGVCNLYPQPFKPRALRLRIRTNSVAIEWKIDNTFGI